MSTSPHRKSMPDLLTLAEASRMLGLSDKTIRRYIASGTLTGYRIGPRALRVDALEVRSLAEVVPTASVA